MAVFTEPTQWGHSLGNNADTVTIPDDTGASTGLVSLQKLFQQINQIPLSAGGIAPSRTDFNALFKTLGDYIYYLMNGGVSYYNSTYDYPVGRRVVYQGSIYQCIQQNGPSSTVADPTNTSYWARILNTSNANGLFANTSLSNLSESGQAILNNKADISFSNVNDTANILMVHNAMPSPTVFKNLTLGASGASYTAPSDGYVSLSKHGSSGQNISISCDRIHISTATPTGGSMQVSIPVTKGSTFYVYYTATGSTNLFAFIYANGSVSEA